MFLSYQLHKVNGSRHTDIPTDMFPTQYAPPSSKGGIIIDTTPHTESHQQIWGSLSPLTSYREPSANLRQPFPTYLIQRAIGKFEAAFPHLPHTESHRQIWGSLSPLTSYREPSANLRQPFPTYLIQRTISKFEAAFPHSLVIFPISLILVTIPVKHNKTIQQSACRNNNWAVPCENLQLWLTS